MIKWSTWVTQSLKAALDYSSLYISMHFWCHDTALKKIWNEKSLLPSPPIFLEGDSMVSISYLFSFSRYQTKCAIKFLWRQLMSSNILKSIFNHRSNGRQGKKEGKTEIQKCEYRKNEKSFLDEIRSIFRNYLMAIICWTN